MQKFIEEASAIGKRVKSTKKLQQQLIQLPEELSKKIEKDQSELNKKLWSFLEEEIDRLLGKLNAVSPQIRMNQHNNEPPYISLSWVVKPLPKSQHEVFDALIKIPGILHGYQHWHWILRHPFFLGWRYLAPAKSRPSTDFYGLSLDISAPIEEFNRLQEWLQNRGLQVNWSTIHDNRTKYGTQRLKELQKEIHEKAQEDMKKAANSNVFLALIQQPRS